MLLDPGAPSEHALALARERGLSITVADALVRAGHDGGPQTGQYLEPKLSHLTPPGAMAGREAATERIAAAIRARERIVVFGDYDCDGITATAIMTEVIRALGGDATPMLASRFAGGYGFSAPALDRVRTTGATLLVTCDCGSSDHDRLLAARTAGIDSVVIDHHLVPERPLPAVAFLNPHRPECGFPFKGLASCGLALFLATSLRKALDRPLDLRRWLDLVAIGTIADVAPLEGDNRVLVRAGLQRIGPEGRPGLKALAAVAAHGRVSTPTAEDVSYQIAPRINAPGRLGAPDLALELLMCTDWERCWALAERIEQLTLERREIQRRMSDEALAAIDAGGFGGDPALVLADAGWHPGVVGIVAGRIAERAHKPTIIVALEGATGRGSARAPAGFRLYDAIAAARGELLAFGGHQAAAGVEVAADRVAAFREAFNSACAAQGPPPGEAGARADVRLDPRDDLARVLDDLDRVEPCGHGNPPPRLWLQGARVLSVKPVKGHLSLELSWQGRLMRGFFPEQAEAAEAMHGQQATLVARLKRDTYLGRSRPELLVEAWCLAVGGGGGRAE